MDLAEFKKLKDAVAAKQSEVDKAQGAFDQTMKDIKKEFGVETVDEAKSLLTKLEAKATKAAEEFDTKLAEFKENYDERLSSS